MSSLDSNFFVDDNGLHDLVASINKPVFIIDTNLNNILVANDAARELYKSDTLAPDEAGHLFGTTRVHKDETMVYCGNRWRIRVNSAFNWRGKSLNKIMLQDPPNIPSDDLLFYFGKMIEVLVHRIRSPLTGVKGYLDMIPVDPSNTKTTRYIEMAGSGIDQIFEMLHELELFHEGSAEKTDPFEEIPTMKLFEEIISTYTNSEKQRIEILCAHHTRITTIPSVFKNLMHLLIRNALEHPSGKNQNVIIKCDDNGDISVTNFGEPIPEKIESQLFFPFVTSKALSMGIGLTLVQLLARQLETIVYCTENSAQNGITFSLFTGHLSDQALS